MQHYKLGTIFFSVVIKISSSVKMTCCTIQLVESLEISLYYRILEAVLVGFLTTSVAFFGPIYLARCKTLPPVSLNINLMQIKLSKQCAITWYQDIKVETLRFT